MLANATTTRVLKEFQIATLKLKKHLQLSNGHHTCRVYKVHRQTCDNC